MFNSNWTVKCNLMVKFQLQFLSYGNNISINLSFFILLHPCIITRFVHVLIYKAIDLVVVICTLSLFMNDEDFTSLPLCPALLQYSYGTGLCSNRYADFNLSIPLYIYIFMPLDHGFNKFYNCLHV